MLEKIIRDFMTIWTTIDPISSDSHPRYGDNSDGSLGRICAYRIVDRELGYTVSVARLQLTTNFRDQVLRSQGVFGARLYPA